MKYYLETGVSVSLALVAFLIAAGVLAVLGMAFGL